MDSGLMNDTVLLNEVPLNEVPLNPERRHWSAHSRRFRAAGALAAGGLVLALAVGCTSASQATAALSSSSSANAPAAAIAGGAQAADGKAGSGSSSAAASSASAAAPAGAPKKGAGVKIGAGAVVADRQVIRTASVTLNVAVTTTGKRADDTKKEQDAVDEAVAKVQLLVAAPGYVGAMQGKGTTMTITLRVPAGSYDLIMKGVDDIGTVVSRQEATEDVTAQMADLDGRTKTMKESITRVRVLLSKAEKIGDVVAIESELSAREGDLESLQSQQAALAGQATLSTITVLVQGSITGVEEVVAPPPPAARSGFLGGLANGWDAVRKVGHAVLTVLGTVIPFTPILAVAIIGGLIWRRRVRRVPVSAVAQPAGEPHRAD